MNNIKDIRHRIERFFKQLVGLEVWSKIEVFCPYEMIGNYCVSFLDKINSDSIIYSLGVGRDISFDLDLINKKGVIVHAFDPTPIAKNWIQSKNLPKNFKFYPYGIANFNGSAEFHIPSNPKSTSYSLLDSGKTLGTVKYPVKRLKEVMKELGHTKIDILKIDIEGGEYMVIEDIINSEIKVIQLLVEFHHRYKKIGLYKTKQTIKQLRENGYKIFYISPDGEEYSFIKYNEIFNK
ncbi:MAG TPA: FkbM family methyltransferase [bacterium]|nr:FkbM family methyltransferase [bacterium]